MIHSGYQGISSQSPPPPYSLSQREKRCENRTDPFITSTLSVSFFSFLFIWDEQTGRKRTSKRDLVQENKFRPAPLFRKTNIYVSFNITYTIGPRRAGVRRRIVRDNLWLYSFELTMLMIFR